MSGLEAFGGSQGPQPRCPGWLSTAGFVLKQLSFAPLCQVPAWVTKADLLPGNEFYCSKKHINKLPRLSGSGFLFELRLTGRIFFFFYQLYGQGCQGCIFPLNQLCFALTGKVCSTLYCRCKKAHVFRDSLAYLIRTAMAGSTCQGIFHGQRGFAGFAARDRFWGGYSL